MSRIRTGAIGLSVAAMLLGCASTPPSSFYTLAPMAPAAGEAERSWQALSVGLGPVTFPVFLDRPQIVARETGNRLMIDEYHRWGGTLQDDFLRVWSENLGRLLGSSRILVLPSDIRYPLDYRVGAEVLAFEGTERGEAVLKVRWVVLEPARDRVLLVREDRYARPWSGAETDRDALIEALSGVLADFSRDVARALSALPPPAEALGDPASADQAR
ncbi:PqiC family protein [Imhoffiella purpurea]|uniref:ABC-type transport auxiliary lipoprotein component domain-containing protein n=1 Tax=Imhoffiella purpurea TaxID=1249627 RepID=W9V1P6_9GAMM|nr:PqiC family protein [Imhoffiella purpurea]EXJ13383.1 Hypothetical protein D779_3779 [Imhoffiella purpurea]